MKIVVLGKGYLGKEFERHGFEVWSRDEFQWQSSSNSCVFDRLDDFDVIINCIGKSNTRWCETNLKQAIEVNGYLPEQISAYCKHKNKRFVHISTGCLYDRTDRLNNENDFTVAHCNYTVTKWIGEKHLNPKDLILRPRLLFSDVKDRNNLLCKLPNYTKYVSDANDSFTSTTTIVQATKELLYGNATGVFNIAQEGIASIWQIAKWCGLDNKPIISIEELRKQQNLYLVNNIMDISKLKQYYHPTSIEDSIIMCYNNLK